VRRLLAAAAALAAVALISSLALAALDSSTFSVGGLTLGVRSQQALSIIRSRGTVVAIEKKPCVSEWLIAQMRHLGAPTRNCVTRVTWTERNAKLSATFLEDFPTRIGSTVLTRVTNPQAPVFPPMTLRLLDRPNYVIKTRSATIEKWCDGKPCSPIESRSHGAEDAPFLVVTIYADHTERTLDAGHSATKAANATAQYLHSKGVTNF